MNEPVQEHRFPCNTCGSDLRFSPGKDQLECGHCGATQSIEAMAQGPWSSIRELDFKKALTKDLPEEEVAEVKTVSCENCGAHVEFSPDDTSSECPFCASPVVTETKPERLIKPKALLPFGLSEPDARTKMKDWLGALWFAPNGLQEYARKGRKMQGIYVPFW